MYSNKAIVNYNVTDGYIEVDGQQLNYYHKEYTPGTKFVNYIPVNTASDSYVFDGWYASTHEGRTYYAEETDVTEEEVDLHVDWKMSAENTEAISLNEEKPVNILLLVVIK